MAYCDDIEKLDRWGYPWHWAINKFNDGKHGDDRAGFMYDAKEIAQESRRLPMLFEAERLGKLPKVHVQCSCCAPEHQHIEDNHLTCCLGVKCRECPMLLALDTADLTDGQRDQAKSWTCIAHIMRSGEHVDTSEGMILTVDDRMFWDRVYSSLAQGDEPEDDGGTPMQLSPLTDEEQAHLDAIQRRVGEVDRTQIIGGPKPEAPPHC